MGAKTKIDWADATWNPVTGCLNGCEYCYARRIAERFDGHFGTGGIHRLAEPIRDVWRGKDTGEIVTGKKEPYPFGFAPTFHGYRLFDPKRWEKPRTIFVCSMADLFGAWVPDDWIDKVIRSTQGALQHRYLFLTKNPDRYDEWLERFENGEVVGLDEVQNCWFGASASNNEQLEIANRSRAVWLSIEPIREEIYTDEDQFVDCIQTPAGEVERPRWAWVVIGAETGNSKNKVKPKKEWITAIAECCREYGTAVFMKESLREIMGPDFIQEFPWEVD